jgi:hypothetical protein
MQERNIKVQPEYQLLKHMNTCHLINFKVLNSFTFTRKVVWWNNGAVINVETLNSSNPIWTIEFPPDFNVCWTNSIYPNTLHFTNDWNIKQNYNILVKLRIILLTCTTDWRLKQYYLSVYSLCYKIKIKLNKITRKIQHNIPKVQNN